MAKLTGPTTEKTLLERAADPRNKADRDRFAEIYTPVVARFCEEGLRYRDRDGIDEVTQEVMIKALQFLPRFKRDQSFRGWLNTATRTTLIDHLNEKQRKGARGGPDHQGLLDSLPDPHDSMQTLNVIVCPHVLGTAFLKVREEFSRSEILGEKWAAFQEAYIDPQAGDGVPSYSEIDWHGSPGKVQEVAAKFGKKSGWVTRAKKQVLDRWREVASDLLGEDVLDALG